MVKSMAEEAVVEEVQEETSAPAPAPAPAPEPKEDTAPQTIAETTTETPEPKEQEPKNWYSNDWREHMARRYAAGDEKAYEREYKRLQRLQDPEGIYGAYRELEGRFSEGGLIKRPGEDASEKEIEDYRKAIGYLDKKEDYIKDMKLSNGATVGEADMPVLEEVIDVVHNANTPKETLNNLVDWWYQKQEHEAAQLDEMDDNSRQEAELALREELGPSYKRAIAATHPLFAMAEGGVDVQNPGSLMSRLFAGRMADGTIIGNDPAFNRWLMAMSREVNPMAVVAETGVDSLESADAEIEKIREVMRTDRRRYNKDTKMQEKFKKLLEAKSKATERASR